MSLILPYRCREVSQAGFGGTGNVLLDGVPSDPPGWLTFASAVGHGNTVRFLIDDGAGNWEITEGELDTSGSPDTLTRAATPIASSNSGSKVNFAAGVKDIVAISIDTGWTPLVKQTVSAAASAEITEAIDGTYTRYKLAISNLIASADLQNIFMRVSDDAGATWKSAASSYATNHGSIQHTDTTFTVETGTATGLLIAGNMGNDTLEGMRQAEIVFATPADLSLKPHFAGFADYVDNGGNATHAIFHGRYDVGALAVNGLQIYASSANISCEMTLYGKRD